MDLHSASLGAGPEPAWQSGVRKKAGECRPRDADDRSELVEIHGTAAEVSCSG
jgi:hypothetical protein